MEHNIGFTFHKDFTQVLALTDGRGVDAAVELVGVNVLGDTLRATRPGGVVCFTGMVSDHWSIAEFNPMDWIPNGVRLTAYSGEAKDLPPEVLQEYLDALADGTASPPPLTTVSRVGGSQARPRGHGPLQARQEGRPGPPRERS